MTKKETILPKRVLSETELKTGTIEIRRAYFKNWYDSCKDIYNKKRRKKLKDKKKAGNKND